MVVDMTAEHPVNEILAIRQYPQLIPRDLHYSIQALSDMVHPKCRKHAVSVKVYM